MVPTPAGDAGGLAHPAPRLAQAAETAQERPVPPQPPDIQTPCLEAVEQAKLTEGFSGDVVEAMARPGKDISL